MRAIDQTNQVRRAHGESVRGRGRERENWTVNI